MMVDPYSAHSLFDCPDCGGWGRREDQKICQRCAGRGWLTRWQRVYAAARRWYKNLRER